ncbi:phage integrase SAM-like domain-containing protein [Flagellimonas myxillae]|uniref:phage integrase SAM-like domain-containing protein n=1 Tax=Flagellimonas myxillae TaxID=2942214 RepID=UPI00201F8289|nr:phage integrase SAM-like domain-containing protein [Muricauda myxillae]MCL6266567.1 site-specific integrase [Muricauda myxillae]
MATVNFMYRSTRENSPLNVRFLFRHENKDYVLGAKSELYIYSHDELQDNNKLSAKKYWNELHRKKKAKDISLANKQVEVQNKTNAIENCVLGAFKESDVRDVISNKNWLKETLELFYRPIKENEDIPVDLIPFFEYYIGKKKGELSDGRIKTLRVTQHKLEKFQSARKKVVKVNSINDAFKNEFSDYSNEKQYSINTLQKDLKIIKTVCRHAKYLGLEVHPQMEGIRLPHESAKSIYLNNDELNAIKDLVLKQEYLDNARDWLLISCYTGQRVSDFMRFTKDMLRFEDDKHLLEFKQVKTNKRMVIPVSKEVRGILAKRNGEFPRPISDQRYNDWIKVVCEKAKINELCEGKKRVSIAAEGVTPTKNDYRDVVGKFEKWELVTSHIGRRSFATNHYGKIPTTFLIYITGHSTEKQFLSYIKKSNKDLALEAYKYFE